MHTIIIAEGINLTASKETIDKFLQERKEIEARKKAIEWLKTNEHDQEYSDIYKEVYGVRPRG